jgi:hypothetical protein
MNKSRKEAASVGSFFSLDPLERCPLLAQSGRDDAGGRCPLLGIKRTSIWRRITLGRKLLKQRWHHARRKFLE